MNRSVFALTASLAATFVSTMAMAQSAPADSGAIEARRQYELATAAFEAKRYAEAAAGFDAAVAIRPHPVTLFIAAVAWDEAKEPERAADDYARALGLEGLDATRTQTAKSRLAELERTLGTIVVTAPRGVRVHLDGARPAPAPARLHGASGRHTLHAAPVDAPGETRDVVLVAGETKSIALDGPAPDDRENENVSASPGSGGWPASRVVGVTGMVAGVGAIGAGIFLGLRVLDARDAYYASPTRDAFDHTRSLQTWTNVCWIAGGGLLAAGAALTFLPDILRSKDASRSVGLMVTGRGIGVRGAF